MSKTIAVSLVKDEADIIEATVRNMARQADAIIVADNGSTDGTREILADLARSLPLSVVDDPEPAYMQSDKMTALAHRAGGAGADWIIPFDADEIWYCTAGHIGDHLDNIGEGMMVATAGLFDHVATGLDSADPNPVKRLAYRRRGELALPKVACRYRPDLVIHQGNHGCSYGGVIPAAVPLLVVRHFPYRSPEQFLRKIRNGSAAYRAAGDRLSVDTGAHWRQWGDILQSGGEEAVLQIFRTWYYRENPTVALRVEGEELLPLLYDPAPFQ